MEQAIGVRLLLLTGDAAAATRNKVKIFVADPPSIVATVSNHGALVVAAAVHTTHQE